ncbi:F-BAR domain only protein 1 [Liparis tanakae]|uniref:F-BAR domain only protein 1 n=1 Tax=Liparis tanakae TaxID=230148 RepID=A0A4Z2EI95_9TELE|nr:F-BAR domain only protein 1 [Liparis tanakae]
MLVTQRWSASSSPLTAAGCSRTAARSCPGRAAACWNFMILNISKATRKENTGSVTPSNVLMTHRCTDSEGEKNAGFDVLYHNMKHGQLAPKELAEFVRERCAELKSKKAAESLAACVEKFNRVGGEFEQKMSESSQVGARPPCEAFCLYFSLSA